MGTTVNLCPVCLGKGKVYKTEKDGETTYVADPVVPEQELVICPRCDGIGTI